MKGTRESEIELDHILEVLLQTDALEWIFFLCILKQDAKIFQQKLLSELHNQKRLAIFMDRVNDGTGHLLDWAETKCSAYVPVINVFKQFLDA